MNASQTLGVTAELCGPWIDRPRTQVRRIKETNERGWEGHGRIQTGTQGARGTCPLQTVAGRSGRIGSVLLAFRLDWEIHKNMHKIAQNCVCNAQKSLAGWGSARDPAGELTVLPKAPNRLGSG